MKRQDGYLTKKSGSWLGHYSKYILDHGTGQRKRRQLSFKIGPTAITTKTQARDRLRTRIVEEVGITADSRVTLAHFIEHRWLPLHSGRWRDSTKRTNTQLLAVLTKRFGATALEDVDSVQLHGWLNTLARTRSASVVKHLRFFIRGILAEAVEQDYVKKNAARSLQLPRLKAAVKPYLSLEEIRALLKAATVWPVGCTHPRERALLRFLLVTALRPSELFALRWRCLDMVKNTLTITETVYRNKLRDYTKTTEEGEVQRLAVPEMAVQALVEWHADSERNGKDDFIFPNADGGFLSVGNYQKRVLTPLAELAGIKRLNFQILRRSTATWAQGLGSLKDVSAIMRHRQMATTQEIYIQVIDETVRETGELLAAKLLSVPKAPTAPPRAAPRPS
jgi:integrase